MTVETEHVNGRRRRYSFGMAFMVDAIVCEIAKGIAELPRMSEGFISVLSLSVYK